VYNTVEWKKEVGNKYTSLPGDVKKCMVRGSNTRKIKEAVKNLILLFIKNKVRVEKIVWLYIRKTRVTGADRGQGFLLYDPAHERIEERSVEV
jgi:hypothetical protein